MGASYMPQVADRSLDMMGKMRQSCRGFEQIPVLAAVQAEDLGVSCLQTVDSKLALGWFEDVEPSFCHWLDSHP